MSKQRRRIAALEADAASDAPEAPTFSKDDAIAILGADLGWPEDVARAQLEARIATLEPPPAGMSMRQGAAWLASRHGRSADEMYALMVAASERARLLRSPT